ncbi:hypothetical protein HHI36_023640 [Cryptolaemus montrouzieri]|uniref:Endonuclease/exonuclease/phosphatase domain-containing protein n=1 Tax=Cryptolaemus montrouzieri TaxID=559131 RepID=A0ABD2PH33_9CUCU
MLGNFRISVFQMQVAPSFTSVLIWWIWYGNTAALSLPRPTNHYRGPGEVARNGVTPEPSCEELKAMWRLSKRQSRASELTNEIPTFQDPFANNIWQPYYATSRSMGGSSTASKIDDVFLEKLMILLQRVTDMNVAYFICGDFNIHTDPNSKDNQS